jgi:type 1 glutamine amidotransferase
MKSPESLTRKGKREDQDYGLAWIKKYGQGRVFVSSLGHNKEVFWNPEILKMWTEGFRFVLGEIDVATESIKKP